MNAKLSKDAKNWASRVSNVSLGSEHQDIATDYQSRFKTNNSPYSGSLERLQIKSKMEIDTVNIGQ
jgi:hypothetical protein